jgi:hypothetical protein
VAVRRVEAAGAEVEAVGSALTTNCPAPLRVVSTVSAFHSPMQNYRSILAVTILLALAGGFGLAIVFSLLLRRKNLLENLKAVDIWPQIRDAGFDFSGLLYGIWKDYSATQRGMIVKDCRDQHVGRIGYWTGRRRGWISIETPDGMKFEADVLPAVRQSLFLHRAEDDSQSLCNFTRLAGGVYRFEAKSIGLLESVPPRGPHVAPVFPYTMNGTPAGVSCHLGGMLDRGRILVLPEPLPLAVRLFVLAIQGQRS